MTDYSIGDHVIYRGHPVTITGKTWGPERLYQVTYPSGLIIQDVPGRKLKPRDNVVCWAGKAAHLFDERLG